MIHFWGLNALNMQFYFFWFVSSFEHVNFVTNGKYCKKNRYNPNYYVSLMIFQIYKYAVKKNVHSFGGSFDYDFTHFFYKNMFFLTKEPQKR
jgi:hypothetical protein